MRIAGLVYAPGPVVLVGDSVLAPVGSPCRSIVNLAIPGARAADLDAAYADAVAARKPSKLVVLIGINDLRAGAKPEAVAQSIEAFLHLLRDKLPSTQLMALSILPIVENEISAKTNNRDIQRTNDLMRSALTGLSEGYVDIAALFGGGALAPALTPDGLHLNGQGLALLSSLLLGGIAQPSSAAAKCG